MLSKQLFSSSGDALQHVWQKNEVDNNAVALFTHEKICKVKSFPKISCFNESYSKDCASLCNRVEIINVITISVLK